MMSESDDLNHQADEGQMLTAEYYKDGQLQIVEVTPFDKGGETSIISDLGSEDETKYLQVLDAGKNLVHLDLLNITLVNCDDEESSYQVVGTTEENGETTITCVLASEDADNDESEEAQDSYVVMETDEGQDPLVYLQSSLQQINTQQVLRKDPEKGKPMTPAEILEKAKALQKVKALLNPSSRRGRKRKTELPPPMELLSSPNFKLYLYSCKMCNFKCNAIKEMSAHKASEHASGSRGGRSASLQCARCPYKATSHLLLMRHVQDNHLNEQLVITSMKLDSQEVQAADVLVCGACGFESGDRALFRRHIQDQHAASTGAC